MSRFSDSFWSADYAGGLGVLFGKLQQGVRENEQIVTIARMRADAEDLYGQHLGDILPATNRIADGFQRDEGASTKKAYDGVRTEMEEASHKHSKIAANIRELVVYPFGKWCEQHGARVQHVQDELMSSVKAHDKQAENVKRLKSQYYNKCRLVGDLEEEEKMAFKESAPVDGTTSANGEKQVTPVVKVQEPDSDEDEPVEIGDHIYSPDQIKKILTHMLENIRRGETKVPILGTYQNVSTGAEIVEYLQRNMNATSMAHAEKIGQDLVREGYLRLVGNVGSVFANSSKMNYQWRPKAFQITGLPDKRRTLERSGTVASALSLDSIDSPLVGTVNDYIAAWNPYNKDPNETPAARLRREQREADERYKAAVKKLDLLRCSLEELIINHLQFMERCELDRLKAIKAVILDFSGAISNVIPSLQSTVDKMMLFQETIQPLGDLRYLLENYRTGSFVPKVQIYDNYSKNVGDQIFGVDLEARAKADKKRVPIIISTLLFYLDRKYPLLDGDEARRAIWLAEVPLSATHKLRNEVNNGTPITDEVLDGHELPVVASLLRFYLLELPDSLVSSNLYEVMKSIYSNPTTSDESSTQTRISVLQNALGHGQLPLVNVATLDAVTSHFVRLIDLTSADEAYTTQLAQIIAPCILRPRLETSVTFGEKYSYRFLRDILSHHKAIFSELKRVAAANLNRSLTVKPPTDNGASQNSNSPAPIPGRPRAISSDESNRKAHMEERARAIATANANRSRASSPAPYPAAAHSSAASLEVRRHRRDSSKGPSDTRFPVAVSTASPRGPQSRPSLDVPKSEASSPVRERDRHLGMTSGLGDAAAAALAMHPINTATNGTYKRGERDRDSNPDTGNGSASPAPSLGLRKLSLGFNALPQTQSQASQDALTATPTSMSSSALPFSSTAPSTASTVPATATTSGPPPSVLAGPMPGTHEPQVEKQNSLGRSAAVAGRPAGLRRPGTREGSLDSSVSVGAGAVNRNSVAERAAQYAGGGGGLERRRPESLYGRGGGERGAESPAPGSGGVGGEVGEAERRGVQLVDRAMDDD